MRFRLFTKSFHEFADRDHKCANYLIEFICIINAAVIGGLFGTIMNMSGIDVARISFAIWFLLPSFLRIIWLIFNLLLFWLLKLVFKCSRVVAGSPNNNVSSLATPAMSNTNETQEGSNEVLELVDEVSVDGRQPPTEP